MRWSGRALPFVLVASDHGPMIVNRLDFHQLPSGDAYGVGHQLFTRAAFDPSEIDLVLTQLDARRTLVGDPVTAIDCGANIGVHTVEMARHMTGWGHVIAVEAQERLFYALAGNIALLNLFNAQAVLAAVADEPGQLFVPQPNYSRPASFGSMELIRRESTEYIGQPIDYSARNLMAVPQIALDDFIKTRIDFIKLDVEGMEMDALTGATEVVAQYRPTMLIEWIKSDRKAIEDFLRSRDYEVTEVGGNLLAVAKVGVE